MKGKPSSVTGGETLPKVSVITVVLNLIENNREKMFQKCVQSVCAQTYPNVEHIIIDGASRDGTQALLDKTGLPYLSEKDTGIYSAMNKGAKRANGDYLIFMNSDDCFYDEHSISQAVDVFLKTGADAVCGDSLTERQNGAARRRLNTIGRLLYAMSLCHQSFYCKKSVFDEIGGFDETYKIAGDYDLIYKMLLRRKLFVKTDKVLCRFRMGGATSRHESVIEGEIRRLTAHNLKTVGVLLSEGQIRALRSYHYLSLQNYQRIRRCIHPQMRSCFDAVYVKMLMRAMRRFICTIHLGKKQRIIRLFGVTLFEQSALQQP